MTYEMNASGGAGTFVALLARDLRVLRRQGPMVTARTIVQPLLLVFVFAYVFPKIGQGLRPGPAGESFSTVLVPGLVAVAINYQGVMAVTVPLARELGSGVGEIEDRVLAPVPVLMIGLEKIAAGAIQAVLAAFVVFPVVYVVHARGEAPAIHVANWPLFLAVVVLDALLGASLGLVLGTLLDPRSSQFLFALIVLPLTMLGCVYYPWATLEPIRWLQLLVLVNPLVYMSESLRMVMTPQLPHMASAAILVALVAGTIALAVLGIRLFTRRVLA
jgi:ABC-2 type transport system permease protein